MPRKLKGALLDDDLFMHEIMKDLCKNSPYVEITNTFSSPLKFLEALPQLDCDIYLLDIYMPKMSGFEVAKMLNGKPYVFITAVEELLKEALDLVPMYVLTKPIEQDKFNKVLEMAYNQIHGTKARPEKEFFNVSGKGKILIDLSEIMLVSTLEDTPRNKIFYLRNGETHIVNRCNLEDVLYSSGDFIQVNKAEVVHISAVEKVEYDVITLRHISQYNKPKQIVLGQTFAKNLRERLGGNFN